MILVEWVARRARHPRRTAAALVLAVPGDIIVRLADPIGVAAAGALHFAPQDRPLSHYPAARSAAACPRRSCIRRWQRPPPTSHRAHRRRRDNACASASAPRATVATSRSTSSSVPAFPLDRPQPAHIILPPNGACSTSGTCLYSQR